MNEKKEYEIGYVEITTQEYKDLITEAVVHRKDAELERRRRWNVEAGLKAAREELLETQKRVVELEAIVADLNWKEYQSSPCVLDDTEVANNG